MHIVSFKAETLKVFKIRTLGGRYHKTFVSLVLF